MRIHNLHISTENKGTLILDATCAPQNIRFPQDINLPNEARENLERMIDSLCDRYGYYRPRLYRENARKDYLSLAKCRKRNAKKIRNALAKHSYGLGLVTARLDETTKNTIAMSVLAMNIDRILAKRMFIFWAKICGLIRTAILETIKGRKDELCMAAAY